MNSRFSYPSALRAGGTVTSIIGPRAPATTDQKYAGLSREDQRRYRKGPDQKRGAPLGAIGIVAGGCWWL